MPQASWQVLALITGEFWPLDKIELQAGMSRHSSHADLDVILKILADLEELVDVVRCSAVCKAWQAACEKFHPTKLHILPMYDPPIVFKPEGLVTLVKWLQLESRVGCLDNLQRLAVTIHDFDCTAACNQQQWLQSFSQSIAAHGACEASG